MEHMTPGYTAATAEAGTGSHRRRVAKLEAHLSSAAPKMFSHATDGVVAKMSELSKTIGKTLEKDVVHGAKASLTTTYSVLWDDVGEKVVAARRALAPKVADILLEAKNAVRRLAEEKPVDAPVPASVGAKGFDPLRATALASESKSQFVCVSTTLHGSSSTSPAVNWPVCATRCARRRGRK